MRLKTSTSEAERMILSIPHKTCTKAINDHWNVRPDGTVRAQSVLWLFCWAKTGMNSEDARQASAQVFDDVLPISFAKFDALVDHQFARLNRYSSRDIDDELEQMLGGLAR